MAVVNQDTKWMYKNFLSSKISLSINLLLISIEQIQKQ